MARCYCLQDGWGGSSQPWDDTEDNCAPGWPPLNNSSDGSTREDEKPWEGKPYNKPLR